VEEPEPDRTLSLRETESPGELVVESVTDRANPSIGVIVMVEVPWLAALSVRVAGLASILKSTTSTIMVAVCTSGPTAPVTVTV